MLRGSSDSPMWKRGNFSFSNNTKRRPRRATRGATVLPPGPPPMIATSNSFKDMRSQSKGAPTGNQVEFPRFFHYACARSDSRHQLMKMLASLLIIALGLQVALADTNLPKLISADKNVVATGIEKKLPHSKPDGAKRLVYVIPVREDIDKPIVYIVRRGIKEAIAKNADAIVLDMNTNGGRGDCMWEIMDLVNDFKGDTFTFINSKAYSAGAFISAATRHIYMAPGSGVGAAAPMLMSQGGDIEKTPDTVEKKFT